MNDVSQWTNIALVIVALVAAVIAYWARGDAKEAKKIARSDFLLPYFDNIGCLWEIIFEKVGRNEEKIKKAQQSVETLKAILCKDQELTKLLDRILDIVSKVPDGMLEYYSQKNGNPPSYVIPNDASELKGRFNQKRHEYLNIG